MKQKMPIHITARIHAIYNPAPSSYSSGSSDRVVSGLNISIVNEEEYKNLDEISVGLYKKLWFAPWETGGHASEPNIYLVSSSRILKNSSLTSITSLQVGDEVAIDGNFMLNQGGVIVADQLVAK
ncbi:MAG: hypothetical protein Q8R40_06695 [bacterium]|nr:hypothetical protein [bacterium]